MAGSKNAIFGPDPTPLIFAQKWLTKFNNLTCNISAKEPVRWIRHLQSIFECILQFNAELEHLKLSAASFPRDHEDFEHELSAAITCTKHKYGNPCHVAKNYSTVVNLQVHRLVMALEGTPTPWYLPASEQSEEWCAEATKLVEKVEDADHEGKYDWWSGVEMRDGIVRLRNGSAA